MRGPTAKEILETQTPELRKNSKAGQTYLDIRRKILEGEYQTDQIIIPKKIEEEYNMNNTGTQGLLLRLAIEGLIRVVPVKEKVWPNNAAINEYRVADLNIRHRIFSTRQGGFVADVSHQGHPAHLETLVLKVQHADEEVAMLLDIPVRENVIFHRSLQRSDKDTVIAISDTYLPFWLAEMLPELEKTDSDIYQMMKQLGRNPSWCTETVDIVQASTLERVMFELSPDDPSALVKIIRRVFDDKGQPLNVDFLTDRGDTYRFHYSFPLFADGVPQSVRDK